MIDEIPESWVIKKISHGFKGIGSGTTPATSTEEYYNGGVNWLQTGDLNDSKVTYTSKTISEKAVKEYSTIRIYPRNSLVIAMYGATIGKVGILDIESATNQACCVLYNSCELTHEYTYYWFIANKQFVVSLGYGGGQPNISQELIRSLRIPCPPKIEQQFIVNFLNEKTRQIDDLISKKQRLIELLQEERTAIINQAVTKGLDPDVPMKDSGIEWLGEIPSHWDIFKVSHAISLKHGYQFRDYDFTESGIKVVKISQLKADGSLDLTDTSFISSDRLSEFQDIIIKTGDVLMALTGGTIGKIIRVNVLNEIVLQNYRVGNFEPAIPKIEKEFIYWVLSSECILKQIFFLQSQTGQPNIGKEDFSRMYMALPSVLEQLSIANYLGAKCFKIEESISLCQKQIMLLNEYKTALINEAVTGKIDVRDHPINHAIVHPQ